MTAIPRNCLTEDYKIMDAPTPVAGIDTPWFRGNVTLTVGETVYRVYREKGSRGVYLLLQDGEILVRAVKQRAVQNSFIVEFADGDYALKPKTRFGRDFELYKESRKVGSIIAEGFFQWRARISLTEDMSLPAGVFFSG